MTTGESEGWNFADVWETIAATIPHGTAFVHGDRRISWAQADRRAGGVAAWLAGLGLPVQASVGLLLHNCPEYLEASFAAWKARLVPFNTNHRYRDDELASLWNDADAAVIVFHGSFTERIAALKPTMPDVRGWLWVDDGSGPCPPWAASYDDVVATAPLPSWAPRPGTDLLLLYTGGTTGMPKGVMWHQHELYRYFSASVLRDPPHADLAAVRRRLPGRPAVALPACPLMHATGFFHAITALFAGGTVVMLPNRSFDAEQLLDTIEREHVDRIAIVGEVFAQPVLDALDRQPDRWDLSTWRVLVSAGVMLGERSKARLLDHQPRLNIVDTLGSSEAIGVGESITSADRPSLEVGRFRPGANTRVIDDRGRDVVPGSGEGGMVAVRGYMPVGYHKDPVKTAATFRVIDGERYSLPGDWATIEADGTLRLLGRGSQCINTGGEKVYPEEVEEVLKEDPAVADAAVVGVADERLHQAVWAVVVPLPGYDERVLLNHVRARLAGYKAPRGIVLVDSLERGANGKLAYAALQQIAADAATC